MYDSWAFSVTTMERMELIKWRGISELKLVVQEFRFFKLIVFQRLLHVERWNKFESLSRRIELGFQYELP